MIEIKFRAKSYKTNEWVYGNLIKMDENEDCQCFIFPFYKGASSLSCNELVAYRMIPVKKDTICQYIGLKDKYGKEIYEGDILLRNSSNNGVVIWSFDKWCIGLDNAIVQFNQKFINFITNTTLEWEVKGNLYENTEIIGEGENN